MRYTGPSCRQCRREGTKLFLKGTKCFTEKCPVERRPYAPGQHGPNSAGRRRKVSEYAKQLREKQKIKRIYGVSEKQFRNTFEKVSALPGITGHNLLAALESRLDNMVYRMGFAASRKAARQLIRHRHVEVNGKNVDVPSFVVQPGQEIKVREQTGNRSLVVFDRGDEVVVHAGDEGIRFLLVSGQPLKEPVAWYGPIVMNTATHLVRVGAATLPLSATEYRLLEHLLQHVGAIVSREQLGDHVWGGDYDPFSNLADVYVGYLRRKLKAAGLDEPLIQTVRGMGYMLRTRATPEGQP